MMRENLRILLNSTQFSASRSLLPAYDFSVTMTSTPALIVLGLWPP